MFLPNIICSWESYHKNKKDELFIETPCMLALNWRCSASEESSEPSQWLRYGDSTANIAELLLS